MHREDIIASIRQHEEALRNLGIKSLALFGSAGRNEQHAESDIDLLYEFEEGQATLDHFLDIQVLLESVFGQRVDLVSKKYLSPILRRYIQDDLETVL